jgi:hypothetical protein
MFAVQYSPSYVCCAAFDLDAQRCLHWRVAALKHGAKHPVCFPGRGSALAFLTSNSEDESCHLVPLTLGRAVWQISAQMQAEHIHQELTGTRYGEETSLDEYLREMEP